jgi:TRAP-type mannitol/chloroaromatic compound transport system permease small subunit
MFTKRANRAKSQDQRLLIRTIFLLLVFCFFSLSANAQCAMCRAALEGEGNTEKAEAVNDGIVYLMLIPYILVALIGVYRIYRKKKVKAI